MRQKKWLTILAIVGLSLFSFSYALIDQTPLPEEFLLIAHRGASGYAPEHTLPAYHKAFDYNADYLEIDLQQTKDGVLVAFHDDTLDRTTGASGTVSAFTYAELQELNTGSWFNQHYPKYADPAFEGETIIKLEDIFDTFGSDAKYYIETKHPELNGSMEAQLIDLLEEYDLLTQIAVTKQVILQSFSEESLRTLHEMNPDIPLVQLFNFHDNTAYLSEKEVNDIATYAFGIGVNKQSLHADFSHAITEKGLAIHVYTVNTYAEAVEAYNGIFTDKLREFSDDPEN